MSEAAAGESSEQAPQEGTEQRSEPKTFDAEYVKKLRDEAAKHRNEAKANADAAKRLAEIEESQKSEADKVADRLNKAEQRAVAAEAALLRYEVAAEKDIPAKAIRLLQGSTREEIEASAKDVLELLGEAGKPRRPIPDPAQGRSSGGSPSTAEQFAAAVEGSFTR